MARHVSSASSSPMQLPRPRETRREGRGKARLTMVAGSCACEPSLETEAAAKAAPGAPAACSAPSKAAVSLMAVEGAGVPDAVTVLLPVREGSILALGEWEMELGEGVADAVPLREGDGVSLVEGEEVGDTEVDADAVAVMDGLSGEALRLDDADADAVAEGDAEAAGVREAVSVREAVRVTEDEGEAVDVTDAEEEGEALVLALALALGLAEGDALPLALGLGLTVTVAAAVEVAVALGSGSLGGMGVRATSSIKTHDSPPREVEKEMLTDEAPIGSANTAN